MYHVFVRALDKLRNRALLCVLKLPEHALRRAAGGTITIQGRTLDAQAQMLCWLAARFEPHVADLSPARARLRMELGAESVGGASRAMRATRDFDLGEGVRARYYLPEGAGETGPLIVYYHGGGFVAGSIVSHDRVVRAIADESRLPVLSVDYRLAPEHPFPAAADDALRAYLWAREHAKVLRADPDRICLMGDSAGGNLSIVTCQAARDEGIPLPALQVPIYPATDFTCSMPSHRTFGDGFFLDRRSIDHYLDLYAADPLDPRASPLLAKRFDGLPRAIVVTAGFDPLVDEGDAYARKLSDAGVRVDHVRHDSLIHGFINMAGAVDAARSALVMLAKSVRAAFG
jgi:acetyl esterase